MAIYYVRSTTGNDSNNGGSWSQAKQTVTAALNICVPGDTVYVSQNHSFYSGSGITYPAKGIASLPVNVVCVNDSAQPPTQLAYSGLEYNVNTGADLIFSSGSFIFWYGVLFKSARHVIYPFSSPGTIFENCGFYCVNPSQGVLGFYPPMLTTAGNTSLFACYNLIFNNCTFSFSYVGSSLYFYNYWSWEYWDAANYYTGNVNWSQSNILLFKGCNFIGSTVTGLFNFASNYMHTMITADGCDFSLLGPTSNFIQTPSNILPGSKIYLKNCKLPQDFNMLSSTFTYIQQPDIYLDNCDYSGTNTKYESYRYQGTTKISTSVYREDGANNGVNGYSYMLSSNSVTNFIVPLDSPNISTWCKSSGVQKTAEISFVHDSSSTMGSSDIWADIEYQGSAGSPIAAFASTKVNTYPLIVSNPTGPSIDGLSQWNTTGLSSPTIQKIAIPFTPQTQGLLIMRVYLAKPNYTVYVDPLITLI